MHKLQWPGEPPPGVPSPHHARRPPVQAAFEFLLIFIFAADMAATCFVAVYDNENLVTDLRAIRAHYLGGKFCLDLLTTIPFEMVVLAACGLSESPTTTARYISLLRLLKLVGRAALSGVPALAWVAARRTFPLLLRSGGELATHTQPLVHSHRLSLQGRIYRIAELFRLLEYNMSVSLLVTTLVRNFSVGRPAPHCACCPLLVLTWRTPSACSCVACSHLPSRS
jgi:hypothetical protein